MKVISEDAARLKWCPFAVANEDEIFCGTTACMAWRSVMFNRDVCKKYQEPHGYCERLGRSEG